MPKKLVKLLNHLNYLKFLLMLCWIQRMAWMKSSWVKCPSKKLKGNECGRSHTHRSFLHSFFLHLQLPCKTIVLNCIWDILFHTYINIFSLGIATLNGCSYIQNTIQNVYTERILSILIFSFYFLFKWTKKINAKLDSIIIMILCCCFLKLHLLKN